MNKPNNSHYNSHFRILIAFYISLRFSFRNANFFIALLVEILVLLSNIEA